MTTRPGAQNAKTILGIVKCYALYEARQYLFCRSFEPVSRDLKKKEARMAEKDIHYYEPANGHGLKHDPFNAIVAPRPIGWISSRDAKGNINLAPYSFFNAFCYKPPIVGFSSTSWKDSVSNIQETEEFCWNSRDHGSRQTDERDLGPCRP